MVKIEDIDAIDLVETKPEMSIEERKDKINKLLDLTGFLRWGGDAKIIPIDIFDDSVEVVLTIRQKIENHYYLEDHEDWIKLNVRIEDFNDVDLDTDNAVDDIHDIFRKIVSEKLHNESRWVFDR
jgi:hypothetical protein